MKIFSIVGSTAVGKTSFALELAEEILKNTKYSGIDLISADSRQVYQGLEIISGADVPNDFKSKTDQNFSHPFFTKGKIDLHGVSIISPDKEWSVAYFQDLAWEVIKLAQHKNHLVIIIGGTGLYHDQLQNFDPSLRVKPINEVREKAEKMKLAELQTWAKEKNPTRFEKMNHSDINNPRRLIRVIEIGMDSNQSKTKTSSTSPLQQIYLGLNQDLKKIKAKISQRVDERLFSSSVQEVEHLQKEYQDWSLPAFSSLGVSEISQYLNGLLSQDECRQIWALHEFQYAKRQLTWWRNKDVTWFDIDDHEWKPQAFTYILNLC